MRRVLSALAFVAGILLTAFPAGAVSTDKIAYFCSASGCLLTFKGDIAPGDAKALTNAIEKAPDVVAILAITSPGGDPFEALKMSAVLNKYFVEIMPGVRHENGDLITGLLGGDCASACALMYLTTDQRFGTEVFLHRPTFTPEAFRAIPDELAATAYNAKIKQLQQELRDRGVSESLIEEMMNIPSDTVRKLDANFPENSAWMQEWLASKCGGEDAANLAGVEAAVKTGDIDVMDIAPAVVAKCERDVIAAAQMHAQHFH